MGDMKNYGARPTNAYLDGDDEGPMTQEQPRQPVHPLAHNVHELSSLALRISDKLEAKIHEINMQQVNKIRNVDHMPYDAPVSRILNRSVGNLEEALKKIDNLLDYL